MDPEHLNRPKERTVPAAGLLLLCIFAADVFFPRFDGIAQACGDPIFTLHRLGIALLLLLHLFPGLFLIPALLLLFIIQAVRLRKNRAYIKNCACIALAGLLIFLSGCFISRITPAAKTAILTAKVWAYQPTADKIHREGPGRRYGERTGGEKGHEDVAFFHYQGPENEREDHQYYRPEYYILYSEDPVCDVERIKDHARNSALYCCPSITMEEIKENWYLLEAEYQLFP